MNHTISLQSKTFSAQTEALILFLFEDNWEKDPKSIELEKLLKGRFISRLKRHKFKAASSDLVVIDGDSMVEMVVVLGCGKRSEILWPQLRNRLADGIRKLNDLSIKSASLYYEEFFGTDWSYMGKQIALSMQLANYRFTKYKSKEKTELPKQLENMTLFVEPSFYEKSAEKLFKAGVEEGSVLARGIYLTRDLVNEPASAIAAETLAWYANDIAKKSKGAISVKVLEREDCQKLGMGAYLAVAQGSSAPPKFIVLHHTGTPSKSGKKGKLASEASSNKKPKLCLIGKSVTFDTGGYQVKPDTFMNDMKIDMTGGATVLGVFSILAEWSAEQAEKLEYDVWGILPACDNMISDVAFRPGDVLTSMAGKTIEVSHTDAEGRLTLADAITYADREIKAEYVIDMATLTGAIMVALGYDYTGTFANDEAFYNKFANATQKEGERQWRMPLPPEYKKHLEGDIADLLNIGSKGRYGGAITAALFIEEFVEKMKWIHLDIAGTAFSPDPASGITPKGATGWGVLSIIHFITAHDDNS